MIEKFDVRKYSILLKYFLTENGIDTGNHPTIVTVSKDRRKFNQKVYAMIPIVW